MEERINQSETRQCKVIYPGDLNNHNTLFGGKAMQWMDEVAYITATRYTRTKMVTASIEKIKFLKSVYHNTIIELIGKIEKVDRIKLIINVSIFAEEMYGEKREKVIEGRFVFVAVSEDDKLKRIDSELK